MERKFISDYEHTFVICAYKVSNYLEDAIKSCVNQESVKSKKSKILLYTSTPNSNIDQLVKKYDLDQVNESGGSIGKDWNNALSFIDTKFATIVHQDDIYLPSYGTKIIKKFQENKNTNIVFSDYKECDAEGEIRKRNLNLKIKSFFLKLLCKSDNKLFQRRIYAFGNFICCPSVSYNLEKLNQFKFDENLKMTLDWDAWERIMNLDGKIRFIDEQLIYHRIHSGSETTANTENRNRELEEFQMYTRYWGKGIAKFLMLFYKMNQKNNK